MRFPNAIITLVIFFTVSVCMSGTTKKIFEMDKDCYELNKEISANRFISNSFINTCNGNGYKNLNEWQQKCRTIYGLNYIAWCNAEDFMDVSYENKNSALMYGIWESESINGEIYCRYASGNGSKL